MCFKYTAIKTFCSKCNVTLCFTDTAATKVNTTNYIVCLGNAAGKLIGYFLAKPDGLNKPVNLAP